jgi:undecaprenyl-diphosphatase
MAAPIMLAAGAYDSLAVIRLHVQHPILAPLAVGFAAAALVGWCPIQWLIKYVSKHSLYVFAIYCATVAGICLVLLVA